MLFASAELGHSVDKATWNREVPELREALLDAQFDLGATKAFSVVVVIGGVDGAGKRETVNVLNEWLDPRSVGTHGLDEPSDEERERPVLWRFWRILPPRGRIGIFHGSWYTDPIVSRVYGATRGIDLERSLARARRFEQLLADEGTLVLKFWMHLSEQAQAERLRSLEKDPRTRWRVTKRDWQNFEHYDRFVRVCERALQATSTAEAPWTVVEATDFRYQALTVGKTLLAALRERLDRGPAPVVSHSPPPPPPPIDERSLLSTLDLGSRLEKDEYEEKLEKYQGELNLLMREKRFQTRSRVLVFEGMDAAGKGGAIRRVTGALDARQYAVVPIAAPTAEEKAQPYLWRFWRHLPRHGKLTIFDRSWYGRVLVERVEGFAAESDWRRAYSEINDFEEQLVERGAVVCKFWLQVSQAEQLRRFEEREQRAYKRFKITTDDWRNREKWPAYAQAVDDMLERTSTRQAPWRLVAAEQKEHARIDVLRTVVHRLRDEL